MSSNSRRQLQNNQSEESQPFDPDQEQQRDDRASHAAQLNSCQARQLSQHR